MGQLTTCQICQHDFKHGEVNIHFSVWVSEHNPGPDQLGHADCVLAKSAAEENRVHPTIAPVQP
jgi:hypothetical protein